MKLHDKIACLCGCQQRRIDAIGFIDRVEYKPIKDYIDVTGISFSIMV